jgi:hypothetical protein
MTYFRVACDAAGVAKSVHGVREIGAIRAAHGASKAELNAIFGGRGSGMAALDIKDANRARFAKGAMSKLDGTSGEQSIPAPLPDVGRKGQKMSDFKREQNLIRGARCTAMRLATRDQCVASICGIGSLCVRNLQ